jgi:hypothetical protein
MPSRKSNRRAQAGSTVAEFAIALLILLMFVCAVLELARLMYLYNTLQVVTQRAAALAANVGFRDAAALDGVRRQAVFRDSAGGLILGAPVTDAHVRIDYLSLSGPGGAMMTAIPEASLPSCPANNRVACMADPYGAGCIRLVRARICDPAPAGACNSVRYQPLFSFIGLQLNLPKATAITSAETLGAPPGEAPCP